MTIDEKREELHSYCIKTICRECKLRDKYKPRCPHNFLDVVNHSNDSIEDDFKAVFGEAEPISPEPTPTDNINSPSHYTYGKIECIDFIQDKQLNFCLGNAIKYIVRAGHKHSDSLTDKDKAIEDLKKAKKYLEFEIKEREESNGN